MPGPLTRACREFAVADLLRTLYTLYRNPLAHTAKIRRPMSEAEAVEALMVVSFAHRQLDTATRVSA